jgi:hypothetical protein
VTIVREEHISIPPQNREVFKTDKYHKDGKIAVLKGMQVVHCCPRCTDTIQWKIKYGEDASPSVLRSSPQASTKC